MTVSMNTVWDSELIYSFLQTQHQHQILSLLLILEMYSTCCSHNGSRCTLCSSHSAFFQSPYFTPTELLALQNSCKQPLLALEATSAYTNSPHFLDLIHLNLILAVTASPLAFILSPKYVNSYHFCFITQVLFAPLPLRYSLHIFFNQNLSTTLRSTYSIQHIYYSLFTLAFTLKSQPPHG